MSSFKILSESLWMENWLVVLNMFYFHPTWGKWSNLTTIFQRGWNHQLEKWSQIFCTAKSGHIYAIKVFGDEITPPRIDALQSANVWWWVCFLPKPSRTGVTPRNIGIFRIFVAPARCSKEIFDACFERVFKHQRSWFRLQNLWWHGTESDLPQKTS